MLEHRCLLVAGKMHLGARLCPTSAGTQAVRRRRFSLPQKSSVLVACDMFRLVVLAVLHDFLRRHFPFEKKSCETSEGSGVSRARLLQGRGVPGVELPPAQGSPASWDWQGSRQSSAGDAAWQNTAASGLLTHSSGLCGNTQVLFLALLIFWGVGQGTVRAQGAPARRLGFHWHSRLQRKPRL